MADANDDNFKSLEYTPNNIDAEQALLGTLLINNDVFDTIYSIVQAEHFFDPVHARIFEVIAQKVQKNALASPITLKPFFEGDEALKELGGPAYLVRLASSAISTYAAKEFAMLIRDMSLRRSLMNVANDISQKATTISIDQNAEEQIVEAEQALYSLSNR